MSIKVLSWVWENGPDGPVERLVLLALADFCDDQGWCWPSMDTIGAKACMTGRGARNVVRRLEADGWIETRVGGGRGGVSRYRVTMGKPEYDTGNDIPGIPCLEGKTRNADVKTRNAATINPERPFRRTVRNLQRSVKGGARAIPADWKPSADDVTGGVSTGFSEAQIEREATAFVAHHLAHGSRRVDWGAAWRKWLVDALKFARTAGSQKDAGTVDKERAREARLRAIAERYP